MTIQEFVIEAVIAAIVVCISANVIYNTVIIRIMRSMKYNTKMSIVEVFGAIDLITTNECTLYERYFANTTDISFVAMTNSQFINVYNDLSSRVLHAFSPGFLEMANVYLTTDEINTYAAQLIYNFLADKIQTVPDTGQDMTDEDVEDGESFLV